MRKLFILLNVMLSPIILSASNFSPTNGVLINNNLGNSENIRNLQGIGTPISTISASATRAVGTLSATDTRRAVVSVTATATTTRSRAVGTPSATDTRTITATATRSKAIGTPSATVTATRTKAIGTPSATDTATRTRAVGTPSATDTRTITATATRSRAGGSPSATNTGTVTPTKTETMTSTDTKTGTPNITPSITSSQMVGTISNTVTSTATSSTQLGTYQILIQGKQVLGYYNMILTSLQSFAGGSSIVQITSINWLNDVFAVTGNSNQAQLIKTQYESSIQYQQLELQLNPETAVQSPAASASSSQSIALPVGIGVGGLVAVALIALGIVYLKQNNKRRKLISGSNEQEKKNTIQPQHIAINYNDSQTAQKVVNPFQRRNSVGVLEYEPVTVEQRPQSIRNMDLKQAFPPVKTNIFKPLDNTRTKILTKSISAYPPPQELPPPPPFNPDTEDERLPE